MKKLLLILGMLLCVSELAVAQIPVPSCSIEDYSTCTNGSQPTAACIKNSLFGSTVTGTYPQAVNINDSTSALTIITAAKMVPWVGTAPTCASGFTNAGTGGMNMAGGYTPPANYTIFWDQNQVNTSTASSMCIAYMLNVPLSYGTIWGGVDSADILTGNGFANFMTTNAANPGTAINWEMEIPGPGAVYPSVATLQPNTQYNICEGINPSTNKTYIGIWNTSGQFIPGTLAEGTPTAAWSMIGTYIGAGSTASSIPSGYWARYGDAMYCGYPSTQTNCPFPFAPGLAPLAPVDSPGAGSYTTPQTVTISDAPSSGNIYYTLDGSTPICSAGVGTNGILYTGSFSIAFTLTLKEISCLPNYANSTVTSSTYTITNGAGVLSAARSINWNLAGAVPGAPGTLPDTAWTQCGSTISAYGSSGSYASPNTINTAVSGCSAGTYVQLGSGDFYLTGSIVLASNVEVRGAGANLTKLHFNGNTSCNGNSAVVCLAGSNNYSGTEQNYATWTAGFSQGATTLTLSNTLNIVAGKTIIAIDQQDQAADNGQVWNCVGTACGASGSSGAPRTTHTCSSSVSPNVGYCSQVQYVLVTACGTCNSGSSSTVTISPGLYGANWASAQSTGAWWATTVAQQMGVRDLLLDLSPAPNGTTPVIVSNCYECFVFQIASSPGARNHVGIQYSAHTTVMSNYFYGQQSGYMGTSSYAIEADDTSDSLVVNNICQQVVECFVNTGGGGGDVSSYNFPIYSISNATAYMTQMDFYHAGGYQFYLTEGDFVSGIEDDNTHGNHDFGTHYRNGVPGWASNCNGSACTTNTTPFVVYGGQRYMNIVGNVVGQASYHTTLSYLATANPCANNQLTEYLIGCGATGATFLSDPTNTGSSTQAWDVLAENSLMAYNNYDVVSAAAHTISTASSFNDATGSPSTYVGLASPGTLPSSLVFSSKPTFFQSNAYPAIGPDVTGGNLLLCTSGTYSGNYVTKSSQCNGGSSTSAYAGHAYAIPAMNCALNVMGMNPDGSGIRSTFNPAVCYAGTASTFSGSSIPSGVALTSGVSMK